MMMAVVIACLGLGLILILVLRLRQLRSFDELRNFRSQDPGFTDLLSYASIVADGIIVHKNGALSAAWNYQAPDAAVLSDREYESLCGHLNQALKPLGTGWMLHIDAVRKANHPTHRRSSFGDPLTEGH